jgi:2,5-diamino-6-(ribosylamino)-4(3H)-pyrimidinone 5'-phosphate reductase
VHNSISLDGSLTGFQPNMMLHYRIAGSYGAKAHLIGSNTVKVGVDLFENQVPLEEKKDFVKPQRDTDLPYWVIPDSTGKLRGLLHTCRRFEFCRDVIVLVSETTPKDYLDHLKERNYTFHVVGKDHIDLEKSLELLSSEYKIKRVLTDTGKILSNLLINQGFVSELSLLLHPIIVGSNSYNIFADVSGNIALSLSKREILSHGYLWLVYKIKKS